MFDKVLNAPRYFDANLKKVAFWGFPDLLLLLQGTINWEGKTKMLKTISKRFEIGEGNNNCLTIIQKLDQK